MADRFPSSLFATQVVAARYYWPELPRTFGHVEVVCAGWESCRPDYALDRPGFPWYGVELIAQGEGTIDFDGARQRLRTGSLFSYAPSTHFRMACDPAAPFLKYFALFGGPAAERDLAEGPLGPGRVRQALYPSELQALFDRMLEEGNRRSAVAAEVANEYLAILLHKVHESAECSPGPGSRRALASFLRARAFLEEHFHRIARLEDAARELGTTPETLCRLFRHFAGTSPYRFLQGLRVARAADLLLGTDLLVKEVAERAGFDDPFHFSRVFKKVQGVSPAAFQRLRRGALAGTPPARPRRVEDELSP